MEIVSGRLKGLNLRAPAGMSTRPTAVRSRQALFDSLGDLSGKVCADLFAGSGALGLEAVSRGADACLFAESAPGALKCLRVNTAKAQETLPAVRFAIVPGELPGSARRFAAFPKPDLIFSDPPYADSVKLLDLLLKDSSFTEWASGCVIIWEKPPRGGMLPPAPPWRLARIRPYGGTDFLFFASK